MEHKFTLKDVERAAAMLNVDTEKVSLEELLVGMKIEAEHSDVHVTKSAPKGDKEAQFSDLSTNLTDGDPVATMKITLAHLAEGTPYNELLLSEVEAPLEKDLESQGKTYEYLFKPPPSELRKYAPDNSFLSMFHTVKHSNQGMTHMVEHLTNGGEWKIEHCIHKQHAINKPHIHTSDGSRVIFQTRCDDPFIPGDESWYHIESGIWEMELACRGFVF